MLSNFFLQAQTNFRPSQATLNAWLKTDKKNTTTANVTRLSMFDEPISTPVYWFIFVLVIEVIITYFAGEDGLNYLLVGALILGDVFFANIGHTKQHEIVLAENQLVALSNNNEPAKRDKARRTISKMSRLKFLANMGILLLAALKIGGFFLQNTDFQALHFLVLFGYLIAAYLHISFTGKALAYWRFNYYINKEYNKFTDSERIDFAYDVNDPLFMFINTNSELREASTSKHAIIKKDDGWYFKCNGLLLDMELNELALKQKTIDAQRTILVEGIKIQCNQLSL